MTTTEEKLTFIAMFDEMTNSQKDYAATIVANSKNKRVREVMDSEVLEYHKELVKELFDSYCQTEIEKGFLSKQNNHYYRTNRDDQINFIGQYLMLKEDYTTTEVFWKTEDAGQLPVSREVFFMLYTEALQHKNNTIRKYWMKKMQIDACQTHGEIRAIKWDDPQPAPVVEEPPVAEEPTPTEPTTPEEGNVENPTETTSPEETTETTSPTEEEFTPDPDIVLEPEKGDEQLVDPEPVAASVSSEKKNNWKPSYFTRR
jgi:hypothetical protein